MQELALGSQLPWTAADAKFHHAVYLDSSVQLVAQFEAVTPTRYAQMVQGEPGGRWFDSSETLNDSIVESVKVFLQCGLGRFRRVEKP